MAIERPLTKEEILEAQSKTKSAKQAARYLEVSFYFYRKYAKLHGIYEQHQNSLGGKGIEKTGKMGKTISLEDIIAGKHPNYPLPQLKERLLRNGVFLEECRMCGFKERRASDFRTPLTLIFIDNNQSNFELSNLELLCYNCQFLCGGKIGDMGNDFVFNVSNEPDKLELYDENLTGMSSEEIFALQQKLTNETEK